VTDETLANQSDDQDDEPGAGFRPAVSSASKGAQQQASSSAAKASGTSAATGDSPSSTDPSSTDKAIAEEVASLGLKAQKQSAKVRTLLGSITDLTSLDTRTPAQNKLLAGLRKTAKTQDKADCDAEAVSALMQNVKDAERATTQAGLMQFADRVATARGVTLPEALNLIKKAVEPLLKA
tara:strand:+ start:10467 stop:11006 length:540 start_codon:yes stop_codon:yes gene_type:complete